MDQNSRIKALFEKYFSNSCTEDELQEMLDILKRAEHEPEIKKVLKGFWENLPEKDIPEKYVASDDGDAWFGEIYSKALQREGWPEVRHKQQKKPGRKKARHPERKIYQWVKVAAILLISAGLSFFYVEVVRDIPEEPVVEMREKTPGPGEKVRFVLPDGTQVHLNSESRLEYPSAFDGNTREVRLEGEGYFVVTRDEEKPFLVHTGDVTTRVLGTSFNVRAYPEDPGVNVAVASGKVAVEESGDDDENRQNVILEADQWANYEVGEQRFSTGSGDVTLFTAWNSGVLLYQDKTLSEVVLQLERWYGVDIRFENEAIKECVIRGEHRDESLENVLEAITYAFVDMKYHMEDRKVLLTGRGCR